MLGRSRRFSQGLLAYASLIAVGGAIAQTPPPASIDAGRIPQQFNIPLLAPGLGTGLSNYEIPDGPRPEGADKILLNLHSISIEGSTVYSSETLAELTRPYIDRNISLDKLFELAEAITARYRTDGYVLSRAVVPPQRIDGIARIAIVEGFIDRLNFEGPTTPKLYEYSRSLTAEKPLTVKTLERYLLLMNDLPGMVVRAIFNPSPETPGGSDLTFIVSEKNIDAFVAADNRGTRYVGPWQGYAGASYSNIFGIGDRTSTQYVTVPGEGRQLKYGQIAQEFVAGSEGTKVSLTASRSVAHPGYSLKQFDTGSFGTTVQAGITHPVIRSRTSNLNVSFAGIYRDSTTILNQDRDSINSSEDSTRALRLGGAFSHLDGWAGFTAVSADITRGIGVAGASRNVRLKGTDLPPPSRDGGRADFSKIGGEISRLQSLPWIADGLGFYAAAMAQWAFNQSLLASEQFGVGGSNYGRGYDASEITGDYGWAGKAELQYQVPLDRTAVQSVQFYGFYDIGQIGLQRRSTLTRHTQSLASAGTGVRTSITDDYSISLEISKPLTRPLSVDVSNSSYLKSPRLFLSFVAKY